MSRHGGWKAQRSSSGARATSLEAAVAPIHHRRESAGSLDVGFVPAALQRVRGLRPLLKCALRKNRGQRTFLQSPAADGRSRRHRYRGGGTGTNRSLFPRLHSHLRGGPRLRCSVPFCRAGGYRLCKLYRSPSTASHAYPHTAIIFNPSDRDTSSLSRDSWERCTTLR